MRASIQRLGRDAKMHSTMNMWGTFAGVITFLGNNAWDIVVGALAFLATIFTSIATCSFWMGAKSKQLDAMNGNLDAMRQKMDSLEKSNNGVYEILAALTRKTRDGIQWEIPNRGE